jgi:hypothetical protein
MVDFFGTVKNEFFLDDIFVDLKRVLAILKPIQTIFTPNCETYFTFEIFLANNFSK